MFSTKHIKNHFLSLIALSLAGFSATVSAEGKWVCRAAADHQNWECTLAAPGTFPTPSPVAAPNTAPPTISSPAPSLAPPSTQQPPTGRHDLLIQVPPVTAYPNQCDASAWGPLPPATGTPTAGETFINADQSSGTTEHLVLTGNVDIVKDNQRLLADKVIYDKQGNRADAEGNVVLAQADIQIRGARAYKQIEGEQAEFESAQFEMPEQNGRGTAETIFVESANLTTLTNTTYSTCPPGRDDWKLTTDKLKLDHQEGVGTARNTTVRFKNVPFFYTPYISFPLDDRRKSGFLRPSYGSSDNTGTNIYIPYYWNIAPNHDATVSVRNMTRRGVQLGTEYRYLYPNDQGKLQLEYLPDDDLYRDDRALLSYEHNSNFAPSWNANVLLNDVSDDDYFDDLGENLSLSSITHLERRMDLTYTQPLWSLRTRLQNYQPVNSTETYQRLPQITLATTLPEKDNRINYYLSGEFVRFDHKLNVVDGDRLDLYPAIGYSYNQVAYYLKPKLGLHLTHYSLNNPGTGNPDNPSRTVPVFSVDSGVYLERDTSWGSRKLLQTLEPRLFYLYVPHREQNDIPVFDTGDLTFSSASLFRENRFSGVDRQGDTNQVSLAVTSRFIDHDSGFEYLNATVGEIFYLEDRLATLGNDSLQTQDRSDIVADINAFLSPHNSITSSMQWDTYQDYMTQSSLGYRYQPDPRHIFNVSYRQQRSSQEQADISAYWPLTQHWSGMARWYYSLREDRTLEGIAGLEYDSCCWSLRFVARRYANSVTESNNTFFIQLVLKGLSSVGDDPKSILEEGIFGYEDVLGLQ